MTNLKIRSPFNAPLYHEETVNSTMDISRKLAYEGAPHGTVITADFQEAGRGRIRDRHWEMDRGMNLPFTILLRYPCLEDIPTALTLRAGLAVSLAIEDFAHEGLQSAVLVKWPNDIMIGAKKAAGILCEADGGNVHLGIGINVMQREFPVHLRDKAISIAAAIGNRQLEINKGQEERFYLLEKILVRLYDEFETTLGVNWKSRLEKRLFKKGGQVTFIEGAADSSQKVQGCLAGLGDSGELLILPNGENKVRSFITGELLHESCKKHS
jgi:BirA family biotin operon repressor/biotin-[acetyl-CoA-carboxylase] ligase